MKFTITSPGQLSEVVNATLEMLDKNSLSFITLSGDLGAGKTTFVQVLARTLGITEPVVSPTFMIEQRYNISGHPRFKKLIHLDSYRLSGDDEFKNIGLDLSLEDLSNLVCLEWPEMMEKFVATQKHLHIAIAEKEGVREITIAAVLQ